jgi:hypothetical protein
MRIARCQQPAAAALVKQAYLSCNDWVVGGTVVACAPSVKAIPLTPVSESVWCGEGTA